MDKDKQIKETHFVIRSTDEFKKQYKDFCDENGYTMSKRLTLLMKKDMENKLTIEK